MGARDHVIPRLSHRDERVACGGAAADGVESARRNHCGAFRPGPFTSKTFCNLRRHCRISVSVRMRIGRCRIRTTSLFKAGSQCVYCVDELNSLLV
jgi:hypothetical protein